MQSPSLIFITNHFPFGKGEEFIDSEFPYLKSAFPDIYIISKDVPEENKRPVARNSVIERYNPVSTFSDLLPTIRIILTRWTEFTNTIHSEIGYLRARKKAVPYKSVFHHTIKAFQLAVRIEEVIKKHKISGPIVLYSYWFNSSALAITLVRTKNKTIKIARAHGGDLYEERKPDGYQPFRELAISKINQLYTISEDGAHYLKSIVTSHLHEKINVARLGTKPTKKKYSEHATDTITLVSCSNLIPLKRIHLIIDALGLIDHISIEWNHIGDGHEKKILENKALTLLSQKKNIKYRFHGYIKNDDLLKFYSENHIDLFINTSEYEGIPVTMMEAMSFGIPVIGTNVGAVSEIVTKESGMLVNNNPDPTEIAKAIESYFKKTPAEREILRQGAYNQWSDKYNSEINFSKFADSLKALIHEVQ